MQTWQSLRVHEKQRERFRLAVANGRLASSFLLVGPDGIGKRKFAHLLAQSLLCERYSDRELEAWLLAAGDIQNCDYCCTGDNDRR